MIDLALPSAISRTPMARAGERRGPLPGARALSPSVRRAQPVDLPALARLINRAYAVERSFVAGERTDVDALRAQRERGHFLVLDGANGELVAAVYVRIDDDRGTIGLLAVAPDCQGRGLGRRLVAVAEALCVAVGCTAAELAIVNLRPELGPWYKSQGYREVGTAPFDQGPATQPCHLIRMHKALA